MSIKNPSQLLEKTLDSKEVFRGNFLRVQQETVEHHNGSKAVREYIKHPGAVLIIPLLPDGSVIMLQQYRHALKKIFWELPAGKIDRGEDPLATAHRELQEETGYTAGQMKWLTTIHPVIGYANEHIEIYLATDLKAGQANPDEGEYLLLQQKSLKELIDMIRNHEITDVKTQIALFWLEKLQTDQWQS